MYSMLLVTSYQVLSRCIFSQIPYNSCFISQKFACGLKVLLLSISKSLLSSLAMCHLNMKLSINACSSFPA